ncbi:MAG: class I SAM-dependent methyltransferase [Actinobacteria bacterium]|nr:class I SAM-dependent methyltransferase [Actinomycetota bacterium]
MARTDNDSWDLASSVGATATAVAASRALASKGPGALLDDPLAEPLVRAVGLDPFVRIIDGELTVEGDPFLDPKKMSEQIAVRTRFFDDFFRDASRAGIRQSVILAAGLDTRAYRLPWPTGSVVYEIDQPDVIAFKTRTIAGLGTDPAAEHRTVGIDLRGDWPAALRDSGFDVERPTAWIAEGLLVYLPPDAQDRLFDNITALSAPGSRVATEQLPNVDAFSDELAQKFAERWQKSGVDINIAELVFGGDRNAVTDYLAAHGWQVSARSTRELYAMHGFAFPDDEMMTAVFGDMSYVSAVLS